MANRIIKPDSGNTLVLQDEGGSAALTIPTSGIPDFPNGLTLAGNTTGGNITGVTLDDYEEGSFPPSGNVITFSSASGSYTRIGRVVHVLGAVVWPTTSDANIAMIRSLPFNVSGQGTGHIALNNIGGSEYYYLTFSGNDYIRFYNSSIGDLTNANFSGKTVYFQATYFV